MSHENLSSSPWTEREKELLKLLWPNKTALCKALPDRSMKAIESKAYFMGVTKPIVAQSGVILKYIEKTGAANVELSPGSVDFGKPVLTPLLPEAKLNEADALKFLTDRGYKLTKTAVPTDQHVEVSLDRFNGKTFKVGIVGDQHLGSKYQQLSYLKAFYKLCEDEGVVAMLNAGDLVEGNKMHPDQEYEVFRYSADEQLEYAIEHYPKINGIKTYLIAGNHDLSWYKRAGLDILHRMAQERDDIVYLGHYGAYVTIAGVTFYLMHGAGGNSYARSYKMQKIIEQFAPGSKPNVLVLNHYHIAAILPAYRNVVGIMPGCFQAQTPFLRRLGLNPDLGSVILEVTVNDADVKDGLVNTTIKWVPFPVPIENDY